MEDAALKLAQLASSVTECERCPDLVATRVGAVPGGGHPHAHVMVVAAAPTVSEEAGGKPAGSDLLDQFAELLPGLGRQPQASVYTTALVKCVPRDGQQTRTALPSECGNCYGYLSREISTITPHVLVPIGAQTVAYILARLLGDDAAAFDPLDLRVIRTPAFCIAPVPSPSEVSALPPQKRKACLEQLQALAARLRL